MIRNTFLCIIVLAFCLFAVDFFTIANDEIIIASNSDMGMFASVVGGDTSVLTNNSSSFYDNHAVDIGVFAGVQYDGSYVGECYVTGNGERDEDFLGGGGDIYYLGSVWDNAIANLVFRDQPNVDVPGAGGGWCRIRGVTGTLTTYQQHEEEVSNLFNF